MNNIQVSFKEFKNFLNFQSLKKEIILEINDDDLSKAGLYIKNKENKIISNLKLLDLNKFKKINGISKDPLFIKCLLFKK